ncbi:hypothetical protein DS909_01785 [Phaeobacter gallaeciensis]|uniref:Uncharacterized protein n=1 Tax=Phaeobacter gallaeciensis TaxID=60890 RepID=A0A366XAB6_9RHOB|nr:hypothetical protein DS909_01785 [Phaeobacter gallaeciensis]
MRLCFTPPHRNDKLRPTLLTQQDFPCACFQP